MSGRAGCGDVALLMQRLEPELDAAGGDGSAEGEGLVAGFSSAFR
jgi:hypothetical protein